MIQALKSEKEFLVSQNSNPKPQIDPFEATIRELVDLTAFNCPFDTVP